MSHAVTAVFGALDTLNVLAQAPPPKVAGPSFNWLLALERTIFTIVMTALAIAAAWTGLKKGGKPAHALDYLFVALIVGAISYLVDPNYLGGLYGAVSGFLNGTNG